MTGKAMPPRRDKGRAGNLPAPAQEQLDLGVRADAEIGPHAEVIHPSNGIDDKLDRLVFVPSNRERLLRQLSALILAPDFPPAAGIPVDPSHRAILIGDGLRHEEIDILADGKPQRFPVLAELRGAAVRNGSGSYGIGDVLALHFRSEDEASNFRFRPVDEFDTDFIPCLVAPSLFGLDGQARFSAPAVAADPAGREPRKAGMADRIAGAVCCLLELQNSEPQCREAVAELLSGRSSVPWARALASAAQGKSVCDGAEGAIMLAFMEHGGDAPRQLIRSTGQYLAALSDRAVVGALPRWLEMADAVLSSELVLDGDILSDNRSIALRAAILAVMVDDVKNLATFLHAERPAGKQVVVAAAFLIGLKTGVADLSWKTKVPHLELLSALLGALHHADPMVRHGALDAFDIEPDESASPLELVMYWRELQVLRWTAQSSADQDPVALDVSMSSIDAAESVAQTGTTGWTEWDNGEKIDGPGGRVIDVMAPSTAGGMTTLRLLLNETDRLRKPKELLEAACTAAVGWRVGVSAEGIAALYLDVPDMPSDELIRSLTLMLAKALAIYLMPQESKTRSRRKKTQVEIPSK